MSACNIQIKLGQHEYTFTSDEELDLFLRDHSSELKKIKSLYKLQEFDKTFSISEEQDIALTKVSDIISAYNRTPKKVKKREKKTLPDWNEDFVPDVDEYEYADVIQNSISVSKYVEIMGNRHDISKPQITGMNSAYELYFKEKLRDSGIKDEAVIEQEWKREEWKGKLSARLGDDIHYIMEIKFRQIEDPTIKIDYNNFVVLTEEDFKKFEPVLDNIVNKIKSKYPNAKFYPEFPIVSKELCSGIKDQLKQHQHSAKTINGRIDLLVIDEHGEPHVIDWKTSSKRIGSWKEMDNKILGLNGWKKSATKVKNFAQIGNDVAMLEQYGLSGDGEAVPIYCEFATDESGHPIKKVVKIEEDKPIKDLEYTSWHYIDIHARAAEYTYSITTPIEVKDLQQLGDTLNAILPGTNIAEQHTKHFNASIEHFKKDKTFVKVIQAGTPKYESGYRYMFYKNDLPDKSVEFAKSEEELDEKLRKYAKDVQDYMATEMTHFAKDFFNVMYNKGENQSLIDKWLANFSAGQSKYIQNRFRKYYRNGWQLTINDELNNNGIFLFKKNNVIDIVILSSEDLHHVYEITGKHGTANHTVVGAKLDDNEVGADPLNIMNSEYGNLLLIKAATLMAKNPDLFKDAKIGNIKAINPWHKSETSFRSVKYFTGSWNTIARLNPELNLKLLDSAQFLTDIDRCLHEAQELLLSEDINRYFQETVIHSDGEYTRSEILYLMKQIRTLYPSTYKMPVGKEYENRNIEPSPEALAYQQLGLALLHTRSLHVYSEPDVGKHLNRGIFPVGLEVSQIGQSESTNVRALGLLFSKYREFYTSRFNEVANEFIQLCNEVYEEWGVSESTLNPTEFFKNFIETDEAGNISPEMLLKRPSNPDFADKPKSQEFVQFIADTFAPYRFSDVAAEDMDSKMGNNEYWQIPLLEARLGQQVRDSIKRNGVKGFGSSVWQKVKDTGDKVRDFYTGKEKWEESWTERHSDTEVAYNRFLDIDSEQRAELLSDANRVWSTDLKAIFLHTMSAAAISDASKTYGPDFAAFRAAINYEMLIGNNEIPEIYDFINNFIKNKVFLKQIRERSLDTINSVIQVIKKVSSMATLGLNIRNFTKEMITQMYITATRSWQNQIPNVNAEDFYKAFTYVITKAPVSLNTQGFMSFLNQRYAMSNYGIAEMADTMHRNHIGLQNLTSGDVFIGTKIPDDYYRLTILIARMMHDGCFDAYVQDGDTWRYDMHKDPRFTKFLNNDKSDIHEYMEQKRLYESYKEAWKRYDPDGDYNTFPDAYPPEEKASIRDAAGQLYGFFDSEDKSLLCSRFLGAAFMQYKTWLSAKLNQWLKAPGFTNLMQRHWVKNGQGKRLYLVSASQEELDKGMDILRYVAEDDPDLEKYVSEDRAAAWIIEEGSFQEGMIQATGAFLADLLTWDYDSFKRHWEDPITRGQFINGLFDVFGVMLFAGLVKLLFGEEVVNNRKEQDWVTQWSYGVLMGFANDGPFHQVIYSVMGDLNPPSILAIKQWAQTANSVLSGSKSLGQGIVETFGATRELRGYFYAVK